MTAILNEDPPAISQIAAGHSSGAAANRASLPGEESGAALPLGIGPGVCAGSPVGLGQLLGRCSSSKVALALDVGSGDSGCRRACRRTHCMVENAARRSGGGVCHTTHRRWRTKARQIGELMDRGSISTKGRLGVGRSHRSPSPADVLALVDTRLVNPQIAGLEPDGSALLALVGAVTDTSYPLWSIPLPAGEPRRLGNLEVVDAGVFPDGRITFGKGTDLFVADKDGSNPHKLVSVADYVGIPVFRQMESELFSGGLRGETDSLLEIATDGTGLRTILNASQDESWVLVHGVQMGNISCIQSSMGAAQIYGRYRCKLGFSIGQQNLFDSPMGRCPTRCNARAATASRYLPSEPSARGELVRYDMKSHQFVPFLSGISAISPTFSKDGQWVAYTSYPDHTLWRSRSDGTERRQLTYPPMEVASLPFHRTERKLRSRFAAMKLM